MKKVHVFLTIILVFFAETALGQAKKPTIMVLPADVWCFENGYSSTETNQGRTQKIVDYERAFQENSDLVNVITKVGELMADQGFPLKDMASEIKNINRSAVEDENTVSSTSGAVLSETPLEKLSRRAKADILVEVTWKINGNGPKKSVTYTLRGIDAYSNKQVAAAQGTGAESFSASTPVLIEEAVIGKMDNFISQLQAHFDDMMENGREIVVRVQSFDNGSGLSMESEYEGEELTDIIDAWMNDNSVRHRYNLSDAGETSLMFEQVRIPLYRENGSPMDARQFVTGLRKYLSKAPYNITSKIVTKGLGQANLILGEK